MLAGVPFKTYTFLSSNGTAAKVDFSPNVPFFKNLKVGGCKWHGAFRDDWIEVAKLLSLLSNVKREEAHIEQKGTFCKVLSVLHELV